MRIGHFVSLFPSKNEKVEIYGSGNAAYNLCAKLAQKGHNIEVFVPFKKDLIENYENMTVHFSNSFIRIRSMYISHKLFSASFNYDLDIVHIHNDTPMSIAAGLRIAKKKKIPLVVTWHSDLIENFGGIIRMLGIKMTNKYLIPSLLEAANVIITPSICYAQESRLLNRYKDKIVWISNGINLEEFNVHYSKKECRNALGLDKDKKMILFVGSIYHSKGVDVLLKAVSLVIDVEKDAFFVFVGGGKIEKYRKMSEKLGVENNVKFTGFVGDVFKKAMYYRAADVFVLPSTMTESFGIVNLEAMACGVPIVASKIGGIPDVVKDGENGLLVPPKDSNGLADAIIYLLENEDVREKMGKNGGEKVEDYSWERIAEETEEVYLSLLESKQ